MLKRLHLRNFTVFEDADFEFGPGLNVIVGTNGTGKSHVLKVGYAVQKQLLYSIRTRWREVSKEEINNPRLWFLEDKIKNIFRPAPFQIKELIRRNSHSNKSEINAVLEQSNWQASSSVWFTPDIGITPLTKLPSIISDKEDLAEPVFIPAKEVLTMGWLLPLYNLRDLDVDETYPNLLQLLAVPSLKLPTPETLNTQVHLMRLIGGKVEEEGGHFYLSAPNQPRMEMNLVAEGMRKFATLYKLLANGTLTTETTLFWDEPEANLNPALLKEMAAVLTELAKAGFQIILATHSLFLLKELHILAQREKQPAKYFALYAGENGATQVETKDDFIRLEHVAALDAELTQTFDFEATLDDEYAGDS